VTVFIGMGGGESRVGEKKRWKKAPEKFQAPMSQGGVHGGKG